MEFTPFTRGGLPYPAHVEPRYEFKNLLEIKDIIGH